MFTPAAGYTANAARYPNEDAINRVAEAGVMWGCAGDTFCPTGTVCDTATGVCGAGCEGNPEQCGDGQPAHHAASFP